MAMNSSLELQREDFFSKRNLIQKVLRRRNFFQTIMQSITYEVFLDKHFADQNTQLSSGD